MKRSGVLLTMAVAIVCLAAASLAHGAGERITVTNTKTWNQAGSGGPFTVKPLWFGAVGKGLYGAGSNEFVTFCIETNEYLTNNQTSYVRFDTQAVGGGAGGGNPDPLSVEAAYLYQEFIKGNLAGIGTGATTFTYALPQSVAAAESGEALQQALWFLEEEVDDLLGSSSTAVQDLAQDLLNYAAANAAKGYEGRVRVMQLWANPDFTGARQDLLVMIPLPMPAGMALAGLLGIGVVAGVRRRMRM